MCGITGIISFSLEKNIPELIKKMSDKLSHRGPDGEGFLLFNETEIVPSFTDNTPHHLVAGKYNFSPSTHIHSIKFHPTGALGHRRLSILDTTEAGHQPMCTPDGKIWITYNGEIYNYIELKNELIKDGYSFKTQTDTEVILASYQKWGKNCIDHFNGMWAFVIYDPENQELFGSRDRFGVKPFYYFLNDKIFAFSSEQKALLTMTFIKSSINEEAAFTYLASGISENKQQGLFQNIIELMPSECFSLNTRNHFFKKWNYYQLNYENKSLDFDVKYFNNAVDKCKELIENAILLRLRSDVSVGSCLSGGLDSSTIVCFINKFLKIHELKQIGEQQKVFTACYNNYSSDESHWAEMVVNQTNTKWHKCYPSPENLIEDFEKLVYHQDIPFFSTSTFAHYRVMKLAKEAGVKVTLDGQGGDEIFAGYDPHVISFWLELLRKGKISLLFKEFDISPSSLVSMNILSSNLMKYILFRFAPLEFTNFLLKKQPIFNILNKDFVKKNDFVLIEKKAPVGSSLNTILHDYMTSHKLKVLLKTTERNAMANSIESRVPFSDDINLIEFLFGLSACYKIHDKKTKYILRESIKGLVPEKIRMRKDKIGFATPESYFMNSTKHELKKYITPDLVRFINTKALLSNWDNLFSNENTKHSPWLWRLINFAAWKSVYKL